MTRSDRQEVRPYTWTQSLRCYRFGPTSKDLAGTPSVFLADLVGLSAAVDEAAHAMRDSGTDDLWALNSLRQKLAGGADAVDRERRTRDA